MRTARSQDLPGPTFRTELQPESVSRIMSVGYALDEDLARLELLVPRLISIRQLEAGRVPGGLDLPQPTLNCQCPRLPRYVIMVREVILQESSRADVELKQLVHAAEFPRSGSGLLGILDICGESVAKPVEGEFGPVPLLRGSQHLFDHVGESAELPGMFAPCGNRQPVGLCVLDLSPVPRAHTPAHGAMLRVALPIRNRERVANGEAIGRRLTARGLRLGRRLLQEVAPTRAAWITRHGELRVKTRMQLRREIL